MGKVKTISKLVVAFVVLCLLFSCATVSPTKTASLTYEAKDYLSSYNVSRFVWAPFFIGFVPSQQQLKQEAFAYAAEVHRKGPEDILLVNEMYAVYYPGWNWALNWWSYFILNFYEVNYNADIIKR